MNSGTIPLIFDATSNVREAFSGFELLESNYVEIPEQILALPGLDGRERWTLAALTYLTVGHAMDRRSGDREPFGFHPLSYSAIGRILSLESRSGVKARLTNLKVQGLIEIQPGIPVGTVAAGPTEGDISAATLAKFRLRWSQDQENYSKTDIRAGWSLLVTTKVPREIFEAEGLSSMERMALLGVARVTIGEAYRRAGEIYGVHPISYRQIAQLLGLETPAKARALLTSLQRKGFIDLMVGAHLGDGSWSKPMACLHWRVSKAQTGIGTQGTVFDREETEIVSESTNFTTLGTNFDRGSSEIVRDSTAIGRDSTGKGTRGPKSDTLGSISLQAAMGAPSIPSESAHLAFVHAGSRGADDLAENDSARETADFTESGRKDALDEIAYLIGQIHGDGQVRMERDVLDFVDGSKLTAQCLADVLQGLLAAIGSKNPKRVTAAKRHYDLLTAGRLFHEHVTAWAQEGRAARLKQAPKGAANGGPATFSAIKKSPRVQTAYNQWKRTKKLVEKNPESPSAQDLHALIKGIVEEIEKCLPECALEEISAKLKKELEAEGHSEEKAFLWKMVWTKRYGDKLCALAGISLE